MSLLEPKVVRYARKLRAMIRFADELRELGTDPSVKFACVIFPLDCSRVDAIGFNGMPAGIDDLDRGPLDTPGGSGYCHAELNALTKWDTRGAGRSILFVHRTPCMRCAGQIINARKIQYLIHEDAYEGDAGAGLGLAARGGIQLIHRREVELMADGEFFNGRIRSMYDRSKIL